MRRISVSKGAFSLSLAASLIWLAGTTLAESDAHEAQTTDSSVQEATPDAVGQASPVVDSAIASMAYEQSGCAAGAGCVDATGCGSAAETSDDALSSIFSATDSFKNMPLDFLGGLGFLDDSTLSFGGDLRLRLMDEADRLRPGGPGRSTYELWRWRNHLDFRAGDRFRIYAEMLDASQNGEELPVTGVDVNRWNIQNLFVDAALIERDGKPITLRIGRQGLDYGSALLVSTLNWANTRRNFEGFRLMSEGDVWDLDAFATRPVNTATFLNPVALGQAPVARYANERDEADDTRWFSGVYAVYKGIPKQTIDAYWFWLDTDNAFDALVGAGSVGGDRHTFGLRWRTSRKVVDACQQARQVWNLEVEGGFQVGEDTRRINGVDARRDIGAGFFTTTAALNLPQAPWTPTLKFLYYWGSGDDDPADGQDNTFSTLFPFGHFYWGIIDNVTGQNLSDISLQAIVKPTSKLTLVSALHWFDLANHNDVLYNVAGVPLGAVGGPSKIGEELDLIGTYNVDDNLSLQLGYSWFWYGSFVTANLPRDDANQFYFHTVLKY